MFPLLARCTAVTAVVVGERLLVANVGDSRAVLSRGGKGVRGTAALELAGSNCMSAVNNLELLKCCTLNSFAVIRSLCFHLVCWLAF
jgi:protein phosphatase 1L